MSSDYIPMIMCPPYPEYEEAPKDQSHSELVDCPECESKMWLSEKKNAIIRFAEVADKGIILVCYDCAKSMAEIDPKIFIQSKKVGI